jgi:hypothetical protein
MVLGGGQGGLSESAIPGAHRAGPRAEGRASGMGPAGGRRTRGRWVGRRVGRRAGGAYEASSRSSIMAMILSSPNERDEGVSGGDSVRRREGTRSRRVHRGSPRASAGRAVRCARPRRRHGAATSLPRADATGGDRRGGSQAGGSASGYLYGHPAAGLQPKGQGEYRCPLRRSTCPLKPPAAALNHAPDSCFFAQLDHWNPTFPGSGERRK